MVRGILVANAGPSSTQITERMEWLQRKLKIVVDTQEEFIVTYSFQGPVGMTLGMWYSL